MRTYITDALQVAAAILITSGMIAYAAPIPATKPVHPVNKIAVHPKTVAKPVEAVQASLPPEKVVTWQDNPNHCTDAQYIAAGAPFGCIDKPVAAAPAPTTSAPTTVVTGGCQTYFSGDLYLDNIIRYESGGNSCATNYLGCFGLLQACPGAPLRSACGGDPGCQIAWFQQYKTGGRSWAQVWQHELDYGWW